MTWLSKLKFIYKLCKCLSKFSQVCVRISLNKQGSKEHIPVVLRYRTLICRELFFLLTLDFPGRNFPDEAWFSLGFALYNPSPRTPTSLLLGSSWLQSLQSWWCVSTFCLSLFGTRHVRQLPVGCILSVVQQRQEGIVTGRMVLSVPPQLAALPCAQRVGWLDRNLT